MDTSTCTPIESVHNPVVLTDLPEEVLALILMFLNLSDTCATLSTCKYIHAIFQSSAPIMYAHHARIAGVLDNPSRPDDYSTRLLGLQHSERAWRQLSVSDVRNIIIPHRSSGIYDLTGGRYFLGRTDGIPTFTNAHGATKAICSLSLVDIFANNSSQQHSEDTGQPPEWPSLDVGEDIIDVGINASEHDLMAVVTTTIVWRETVRPKRRISLYLVHLSTGTPHAEARIPIIPIYEAYDLDTRPLIMLEVVGDVMGLLLNWPQVQNYRGVFYIIDWKSGNITMECPLHQLRCSSFIFLAPDVLAFSCSTPFSIQLARLPQSWKTPTSSGHTPAKLEFSRTLLLPSLGDNVLVTHFSCRSEPNPSVYGRRYGRYRERMFTPDPQEAIALFHVLVRKITAPVVWGEASSVSFVAHRATLLSLVDSDLHRESQPSGDQPWASTSNSPTSPESAASHVTQPSLNSPTPASNIPLPGEAASACEEAGVKSRTVSWEAWGSKVTQWFPTDHILINWITTSCGTRIVLTEEPEGETGSNITVHDFNRNRVRKAIKAAQYLRDAEFESEAWEYPAKLISGEESSVMEPDTPSLIPGAWTMSDLEEGTLEQPNPPVISVHAEEIMEYPIGDWVFEEWNMDQDDRVLRRSENDQQSGDIRLINGDIPLPYNTNRFFKEQIVGGLPFIAVKRVVEETYQSVLMEDECMIGLKANNDEGVITSIDILRVG